MGGHVHFSLLEIFQNPFSWTTDNPTLRDVRDSVEMISFVADVASRIREFLDFSKVAVQARRGSGKIGCHSHFRFLMKGRILGNLKRPHLTSSKWWFLMGTVPKLSLNGVLKLL